MEKKLSLKSIKLSKEELKDILFRLSIVLLASSLYSLSVAWFLAPAGLLSLGFTGVGQIFNRMFLILTDGTVNIPVGVFNLICNLPLCILGFKYVSGPYFGSEINKTPSIDTKKINKLLSLYD